ncbi:hypothetical protein F4814DRAFT_443819 [Daldinia grandis]|nr:hypothetical protein F4814DRAFT_443819 [Daldinia grandis]
MGDSGKDKSKERDVRPIREVVELDDKGRVIRRRFERYNSRFIERSLAESRARYDSRDAQASSAPQRTRDPGPYGSSQRAYNTSLQQPPARVSPERRDLDARVAEWMQAPSFPSPAPYTGQEQHHASYPSATAGYVAGPSTTGVRPANPNAMAPSDVASYYNRSGDPSRASSARYNPSDATSHYGRTGLDPSANERRRARDRQNHVLLYEDPRQRRRDEEREHKKEKRRGKEREY